MSLEEEEEDEEEEEEEEEEEIYLFLQNVFTRGALASYVNNPG